MNKNEYNDFISFIDAHGLYKMKTEDIEKFAECAAEAYRDYPLHNWFTGGKYNYEHSKQIMKVSLKTMQKQGLIYADSKDVNGFIVVMPPNFEGIKASSFLMNGGAKLAFLGGIKSLVLMQKYEDFANKLRDKKSWYVYNLSVRPSAQGKGIGSKLLSSFTKYLVSKGHSVYLETNKKENASLYKYLGFNVIKEDVVPNSNVLHFAIMQNMNNNK